MGQYFVKHCLSGHRVECIFKINFYKYVSFRYQVRVDECSGAMPGYFSATWSIVAQLLGTVALFPRSSYILTGTFCRKPPKGIPHGYGPKTTGFLRQCEQVGAIEE